MEIRQPYFIEQMHQQKVALMVNICLCVFTLWAKIHLYIYIVCMPWQNLNLGKSKKHSCYLCVRNKKHMIPWLSVSLKLYFWVWNYWDIYTRIFAGVSQREFMFSHQIPPPVSSYWRNFSQSKTVLWQRGR